MISPYSHSKRAMLRFWLDNPNASFSGLLLRIITLGSLGLFIMSFISSSVAKSGTSYHRWDTAQESVFIIFTVEWILNFWASPSRTEFIRRACNIIHTMVLTLFWIERILYHTDAISESSLHVMAQFRVLLLLHCIRLIPGISELSATLELAFKVLWIIGTYAFMVAISAGWLIYFAERGNFNSETEKWETTSASERIISSFQNAPDGVWFVIVTLSTVGYGDIYPETSLGYFIGYVVMMISVLAIALQTSAVGAAYVQLRAAEMSNSDPAAYESVTRSLNGRRHGDGQRKRAQLLENLKVRRYEPPAAWELCKDYSEIQTIEEELRGIITKYDRITLHLVGGLSTPYSESHPDLEEESHPTDYVK